MSACVRSSVLRACALVCARVSFRFTTASMFIRYHHGRNQANVAETETRTNHALDQHAPYTNPTRARARAHTQTHTHKLTFAAQCSVVGIPIWAIAARPGSHRVGACACAVAAAVVCRALVDI